MQDFASVLGEILSFRNDKERKLRLADLAREAKVTQSYISNLKLGNRSQPSYETLCGLIAALRKFQIPEKDIQRLIEVAGYTRRQFERSILSASPEESSENFLLAALMWEIQTRGIVRREQFQEKRKREKIKDILEYSFGDQLTLLQRTTLLLERAKRTGKSGGKIYLTWFRHRFSSIGDEDNLPEAKENLVTVLRSFLWANSPWKVLQLWSGRLEKAFIIDFLEGYLGTANYLLYEILRRELPQEFVAVEGVGALLAFPTPENRYWMIHFKENDYLTAFIRHLEYLLGPEESRKPAIQTYTARRYSVDDIKELAKAEDQNPQEDRRIVIPFFSSVYRPEPALAEYLKLLGDDDVEIELYLANQRKRVAALEKRLSSGQERSIHAKEVLKVRFEFLAEAFCARVQSDQSHKAEARIIQGQILKGLEIIATKRNFNFGFVEGAFSTFFERIGDRAFFRYKSEGNERMSLMAWMDHPEIIRSVSDEFNVLWEGIPPQWRTDNQGGRRQVLHWLMVEILKPLLKADVPGQELWPFVKDMLMATVHQTEDEFCQELYPHEQAAKDILIVNSEFPVSTMPPDIGPWENTSPKKTRQLIIHSLLREGLEKFHIIVSQVGLNRYWHENKYGKKREKFSREWIQKHTQRIYETLEKNPGTIQVEVVPSDMGDFLVNFEIIDDKVIVMEVADSDKDGGIILQDRELSQEFRRYATEQFSKKCPAALKGPTNIAKLLKGFTHH